MLQNVQKQDTQTILYGLIFINFAVPYVCIYYGKDCSICSLFTLSDVLPKEGTYKTARNINTA